jgi:hypothetical protein
MCSSVDPYLLLIGHFDYLKSNILSLYETPL